MSRVKVNRFANGKRWHQQNGHAHFVRTAMSLGWNGIAIDNVCVDVQCQTKALLLSFDPKDKFHPGDYLCSCGRIRLPVLEFCSECEANKCGSVAHYCSPIKI